jgi:hypothetical protein
MASDNLLTPVEKPSAIRDYDVIIAEQAGIDAQATSFAITTTKIAYDTAISDLTSYLATLTTPVLWSNLSGNTTVVGTTFRTNFQTVYTARQAVLDAITAKAKVLVETAQADAGTALGKLADIASDSYLTPNEKPSVILNRDVIRDEQAGIDAQALSYSVSTTTYDDAVSALTAYLATLTTPVAWDTLTDKTEIVGTTFRSKFSDVYIARQAVLDAIVAATRTIFNDIASDNVLTPVEKPIATREYNAILAEQTTLDAQAASYGVSSASYDTKVSNLTTYLTVTITGFSSLTTNTTIDGPTFRTKFEEVYSARQALQTAIVAAAKALADSKIKTSYQAAPGPSSGNSIGDLWVDTTDYVTYRWSGSAWVATSPLSNRTPTGSGLFISATHMGYYAAGNWNTYIGSNGTMWMRGATEPTPTNGMQGLWWEPGTPNRLHIYGDIYLNNSSGSSGGNSYGPQLNISEYGLISMGKNGTFEMHDGDTPTPSVQVSMSVDSNGYSDVTFGSTEGPGYLNFDGETGELTIMGKIIVTDGGDFQPAWYRPVAISASFDRGTFGDPGEEEPALVSAPPYEVGEGIAGRLEMADGSDFYLLAGGSTCILTVTGSRFFKVCILKDIEFLFPDGHIANPVTTGGYNNVVYVFVYSLEEWAALNPTQLANRIVIADAYLSADFSELITLTMRADSSLSIITPDFIRTPHLEALSIQMGHLQGGKITLTNGANTLWFNDGTDDVVLAAGTTAGGVNGAAFKLWENGNFAAGNNDSHISWANPTLYIKGTIQATAGYLNGLTVDGNLTMNGGQIRWNSNNSYIDNSKIVISETNGYSITRIGDIGQLGLIDIDMFHTGLGAWRHGIHITDGGNSLENVSSLYHAMTEKGDDAVDRLYNAIASNDGTPGSESLNIADGYYADIAGGVSSDWASKGVAFKGETDVAPAIVVQRIGTGIGPTVWASGNQESAAVFVAFAGSSNMTAFYVSKTQGALGTIALNTGGGDVNMLDGLVRFTVKSSAASVSSADSGQAKMYIKDNGGQPYIVIKYPNGTEHWFARSFTM